MITSLTYGWQVCKRMWKKLYYRPIHLIVSFIQPVFWLTIFGYLFQGRFEINSGSYLSYLLPGVCAMTILQSSAQSGILFIKDLQTSFFGRYHFAAQSKFSLLLFKILADYSRIIVQLAIIIIIGYIMQIESLQIKASSFPIIIMSSFLFTIFYASLSSLIALRTKTSELMASFVHLLNLPVIFTSTALIPNKNLPNWIAGIASYNPLSHLSELLRKALIEVNWVSNLNGNSWLILIGLAILSFSFCLFYLSKIRYE